jgi:hypothetical protein
MGWCLFNSHLNNVLLQHEIKNSVYYMDAGLARYTLHDFKQLHCNSEGGSYADGFDQAHVKPVGFSGNVQPDRWMTT